MVSTGLVAIDATILATAVPSIVRDLGGFSSFPWLFSVYLLAQAVSVPVYAKLADTVGRKPLMLFGIGLFLLGSVLCGLAWSMPVAHRVPGAAGARRRRGPADVDHHRRRHLHASPSGPGCRATSPASGRLLGGRPDARRAVRPAAPLALDLLRQRPALPAGRRADAGATSTRSVERRQHRIDYAGAVLLTSAHDPAHPRRARGRPGVGLDLAARASPSSPSARVLLVAFVLVERRAAEPVLPLWVFSPAAAARRPACIALGVGAHAHRADLLRPDLSSRARSRRAARRRARAGRADPRLADHGASPGRLSTCAIGFRTTVLIGHPHRRPRHAARSSLTRSTPAVRSVAGGCFVVGLGLGLVAAPTLIAAQSSVGWNERGVVTGANLFARSIGSAVGVAVFGAIANAVLDPSGGPGSPRRSSTRPAPSSWRSSSRPC